MIAGQRRRTSKYAHLLEEDPAFRAWHANVERGPHNAGAYYFLRMGFVCDEFYHIPPSGIAAIVGQLDAAGPSTSYLMIGGRSLARINRSKTGSVARRTQFAIIPMVESFREL